MGKASKRSTLVANSPLCKMYELGFSDGEAKGRRLERRRTRRLIQDFAGNWADTPTTCERAAEKLLDDLDARSKRGKVGK